MHAALSRIEDRELRAHAQAAVESMCWDILALSDISQLDVQQFLWRDIPCRWAIPEHEQGRLAEGLAQLFDQVGMSRYARICRSATTMAMLDAWSVLGGDAAHRMLVRELDRSGVLPADTDTWQWSQVFGMVEARAHEECACALEDAIAAGHLLPGASRWRTGQRGVIDAWLDAEENKLFDGLSPREAVERERLQHWLDPRHLSMNVVPVKMRTAICGMFEVARPAARKGGAGSGSRVGDGDAASAFAPLRLIVEQAALPTGLRLTERGRLSRAFVQDVGERLDWLDWRIGPVRGEDDIPMLGRLREFAVTLGLVRRRRQALVATPRGRAALNSVGTVCDLAMSELCLADGAEARVVQLVLAFLLLDGPHERGVLNRRTSRALFDAGWRTGSPVEDSLAPDAVEWWLTECVQLLDALGLLRQAGSWPAITYELTGAGRAAALVGLRACAFGPARDPRELPS